MKPDPTQTRESLILQLGWMSQSGLTHVLKSPHVEPAPETTTTEKTFVEMEPTPSIIKTTESNVSPQATPTSAGLNTVKTLAGLLNHIGPCTRCKLCKGRTNLVFGTGNPKAKLMFVGEGPGEDEDLSGEPFVGRAGQTLTKMIVAMGFTREDVYIANVVKCRPPNNRNPEPDEIAACMPFLFQQIKLINPKVVVCLGKFASQTILNTETTISNLRGRFQERDGITIMPTFHPAYLLRNPGMKKFAWSDLQMVMEKLKS